MFGWVVVLAGVLVGWAYWRSRGDSVARIPVYGGDGKAPVVPVEPTAWFGGCDRCPADGAVLWVAPDGVTLVMCRHDARIHAVKLLALDWTPLGPSGAPVDVTGYGSPVMAR